MDWYSLLAIPYWLFPRDYDTISRIADQLSVMLIFLSRLPLPSSSPDKGGEGLEEAWLGYPNGKQNPLGQVAPILDFIWIGIP